MLTTAVTKQVINVWLGIITLNSNTYRKLSFGGVQNNVYLDIIFISFWEIHAKHLAPFLQMSRWLLHKELAINKFWPLASTALKSEFQVTQEDIINM